MTPKGGKLARYGNYPGGVATSVSGMLRAVTAGLKPHWKKYAIN